MKECRSIHWDRSAQRFVAFSVRTLRGMRRAVWVGVALIASMPAGAHVSSSAPSPRCAFRIRTPEQSGVSFRHHSGSTGPEMRFMIECVGSGVGMFDADDDGDLDLYLVQGGDVKPNGEIVVGERSRDSLYLNDGFANFSEGGDEVGELSAGFGFGVVAGDVDDDGDEDILVMNLGLNDLLENRLDEDGVARFVRREDGGGFAGEVTDWSMGAALGDIDRDGDLDVYVANYLAHDLSHRMLSGSPCRWLGCEVPCGPEGLDPQGDRLYLNDGLGYFLEITKRTAVGKARPAYAFQPVFSDLDGDGDLDLFVSNDSMPNSFYVNEGLDAHGIPKLLEQSMRSGLALSDSGKEQAGMGVAVGDVDRDGLFDLVMTNFSREPNALYRNASCDASGALFFDEAGRFGLGRPSFFDLGWGATFFDVELDGDADLFIANGHVYPQVDACNISQVKFEQPDRIFFWESGRFVAGSLEGDDDLADLMQARASRGAAAGDLDRDGDVDVVVSVLGGAPRILENTSTHVGTWVGVDLRPVTDSVGSRVEVRTARSSEEPQASWVSEVRRGSSFLGTEPRRLHFGLPRTAEKVSVLVRWPDGTQESWVNQSTGQMLLLARGSGG